MTAIIKKLLALAMAFTLALSLVGCGVNITGVSLNLPDTIEKGDNPCRYPGIRL